jgi:hypothetical protein
MIRYVTVAIGLQVVLTFVTAALLWGYTSQLTQLLIKANNKDTGKNKRPEATYLPGSPQLIKDLHSYRVVTVTEHAILVGVLFIFLAFGIWRGIGIARWLYIISTAFFSLLGLLALGTDGPQLTNTLSFLVALLAIAAIIMLILPQSGRYFATVKATRVPATRVTGGTAAPRPAGLRGLFAPPPPREPRARPVRPATIRPAGAGAANSGAGLDGGESTGRGKPKARTGAPVVDGAITSASAPSAPETTSAGRQRGKSRRSFTP